MKGIFTYAYGNEISFSDTLHLIFYRWIPGALCHCVKSRSFRQCPDSQSYWCCAGSHRQEFFGYASACGCASHIYGCCYPYGLDPRAFFRRSSFYQYRDRYLCDPAPGILSFRNVSGCGSLPRVLCNAFPVVYLQGSRRI